MNQAFRFLLTILLQHLLLGSLGLRELRKSCINPSSRSTNCYPVSSSGKLLIDGSSPYSGGRTNKDRWLSVNDPSSVSFVVQVSTGGQHTCVLMSNSRIKCFGLGSDGQLGYGSTESLGDQLGEMGNALPFVELGADRYVMQVAAGGAHTCALLDNSQVKCFGRNTHGQLGYGDSDNRGDDPNEMGDSLPFVDVGSNRSVMKVAAGGQHTCVLLDNSEVKCFGLGSHGQLGYEDMLSRGKQAGEMGDNLSFVDLGSVATPVDLATGMFHNCVLMDNDQIKCFGSNYFGQLGYEDTDFRGLFAGDMGNNLDFVNLGDSETVEKVATGAGHTCVLLASSQVKCFGHGLVGQLGYEDWASRGSYPGDMGNYLPYVDLATGVVPVDITTGDSNTCVLANIGKMKCFGEGGNNEFDFNHRRVLRGYGDTEDRGNEQYEMGDDLPFVDIGSNLSVVYPPIGASHICTLLDNGRIKCFGVGLDGRLGYEDSATRGDQPGEMGDILPFVDVGFAGPTTSPTLSPVTLVPTGAPSLKDIDLIHDTGIPNVWPLEIPDPSEDRYFWPVVLMLITFVLWVALLVRLSQPNDEVPDTCTGERISEVQECLDGLKERLEQCLECAECCKENRFTDQEGIDCLITFLSILILLSKLLLFVLMILLLEDYMLQIYTNEEKFLNPADFQGDRIGQRTLLPQNHTAWLNKIVFSTNDKPYDDLCLALGGCVTTEDFTRNITGPFVVVFVTYTNWSQELAWLFFIGILIAMLLALGDFCLTSYELCRRFRSSDDSGGDNAYWEVLRQKGYNLQDKCVEQSKCRILFATSLLIFFMVQIFLADAVSEVQSQLFESYRVVKVKNNFGWVQDLGSNRTLRVETRNVELTPSKTAVARIPNKDAFSEWCAGATAQFEFIKRVIEDVNLTTCFDGINLFQEGRNCIQTTCPTVLELNSMEWVEQQLSRSVDTYLVTVASVVGWMGVYQAALTFVLPWLLPWFIWAMGEVLEKIKDCCHSTRAWMQARSSESCEGISEKCQTCCNRAKECSTQQSAKNSSIFERCKPCYDRVTECTTWQSIPNCCSSNKCKDRYDRVTEWRTRQSTQSCSIAEGCKACYDRVTEWRKRQSTPNCCSSDRCKGCYNRALEWRRRQSIPESSVSDLDDIEETIEP